MDNRKWQEIAEQVTKEQDSSKLMRLVGELTEALDARRLGARKPSADQNYNNQEDD